MDNIHYMSESRVQKRHEIPYFPLSVFSESKGLRIGVSPMSPLTIPRFRLDWTTLLSSFSLSLFLFVSMFLRLVNSIP